MKKLLKNRGFTLTEVLVAILIVSVASAALAASVSSASNINGKSLASDIKYAEDLEQANSQNPSYSAGSSVNMTDGESSYSHDVTVYGEGDLSSANSEIVRPTGGDNIGGDVQPFPIIDDDDKKEEEPGTDDDTPSTGGDTLGTSEDAPEDGADAGYKRVDAPEGSKARLHDTSGLFRYRWYAGRWLMDRDAEAGEVVVIGGRVFLITKDVKRSDLSNAIWYNYSVNTISKSDFVYGTYYTWTAYLSDITSKLNSIVVKDEITAGYNKGTLIYYNGQYYYATARTSKTDIPGTSTKWLKIIQD